MIRNYRHITKTDTASVAMGGARCRAVRDSIRFRITIESFKVSDRIPILLDSIVFASYPEAPRFNLNEQMNFDINDEIDYQEE